MCNEKYYVPVQYTSTSSLSKKIFLVKETFESYWSQNNGSTEKLTAYVEIIGDGLSPHKFFISLCKVLCGI